MGRGIKPALGGPQGPRALARNWEAGEAGEVKEGIFYEHLDAYVDGYDSHQLEEGVDWSGAEGTYHVADGFILGCAEFTAELRLPGVPHWGCVSEGGENYRVVNVRHWAQSRPRIKLPRTWRALRVERARSIGHDTHVVIPVELVVKVDAEVSDRVGGFHSVFEGPGGVCKPVWGGRRWPACELVGEEDNLRLVWLDSKAG